MTTPAERREVRTSLFIEPDVDAVTLDLGLVGPQIFDHRRPERLPSAVVKAAVVLGAFNDPVHNQTIAKKGSVLRAGPVAGVDLFVFRLVDRVGLPVDDDGDHVVFSNFLARTGPDPNSHSCLAPLLGVASIGDWPPRA